ncbi:MAG: ATP-dependent DNA helicase, partial [Actinomycetota bacterium]|nr:ATP-dependent DNA helicase [Actinomycetota bacterium]
RNPFEVVDLPVAATLLAQGAGRLIRSMTDRGVVAVLDRRLARAGYRRAILDSLPPMRRVLDGDEVRRFLAAIAE